VHSRGQISDATDDSIASSSFECESRGLVKQTVRTAEITE